MIEAIKIKQIIYDTCQKNVSDRIAGAQEGMKEAQHAANEESKSSAGDKYNTTRALMQIERDKFAKQLVEAQKLQKSMDLIRLEKQYDQVELGSLVETSIGNYFISISIGKINLEDYTVFAISPASPIGQILLEKKAGDEISFQNRKFIIQKIY